VRRIVIDLAQRIVIDAPATDRHRADLLGAAASRPNDSRRIAGLATSSAGAFVSSNGLSTGSSDPSNGLRRRFALNRDPEKDSADPRVGALRFGAEVDETAEGIVISPKNDSQSSRRRMRARAAPRKARSSIDSSLGA
jgi:hypothetical protein